MDKLLGVFIYVNVISGLLNCKSLAQGSGFEAYPSWLRTQRRENPPLRTPR
jgi:hypothetical protein